MLPELAGARPRPAHRHRVGRGRRQALGHADRRRHGHQDDAGTWPWWRRSRWETSRGRPLPSPPDRQLDLPGRRAQPAGAARPGEGHSRAQPGARGPGNRDVRRHRRDAAARGDHLAGHPCPRPVFRRGGPRRRAALLLQRARQARPGGPAAPVHAGHRIDRPAADGVEQRTDQRVRRRVAREKRRHRARLLLFRRLPRRRPRGHGRGARTVRHDELPWQPARQRRDRGQQHKPFHPASCRRPDRRRRRPRRRRLRDLFRAVRLRGQAAARDGQADTAAAGAGRRRPGARTA